MKTGSEAPEGCETLVLASRPENVAHVVEFVERMSVERSWPDEIQHRVLVAASEAATNGMRHGNAFDPEKTVALTVCSNPGCVEVRVEDQGPGFERASVPDPLLPENLLKASGRGVYLIETLADEVRYELGGRLVVMVFRDPS